MQENQNLDIYPSEHPLNVFIAKCTFYYNKILTGYIYIYIYIYIREQ